MNVNTILLQKLRTSKDNNSGFTLIELLVTTIIVGILAAIAIPNFIDQIGKAREAETKAALGAVARAQQGYHWEKQTFAPTLTALGDGLGNMINPKYHTFPDPATVNSSLVKHQAIAINPLNDQVRNYAVGVYFDAGQYNISICESEVVNTPVNVGDNPSDNCTNNGTKLK